MTARISTRIDRAFASLKTTGQKGFIAYITAGDPDLKATADIVLRLEEVGVDIVELGIPFSDPLADGRVNQQSATRALESGTTLHGVLDCIERIRRRSEIPILCYTYSNPLYALGFGKVVRRMAEAGQDGLLILDLPVEESADAVKVVHRHGLNNICLVTPTSPDERIRSIVRKASGFVYGVSRTGVTGMQKQLDNEGAELIRRTKKCTQLPVALGFGISNPAQAREAARLPDAIVVGSAIVNRFHEAPHTAKGRAQAAAWVGQLVKAVKHG